MFDNLKVVFINDNEILAYNNKVAGLFNNYRITSNNAIHQLEDRKLTDEETNKFLKEIEKLDTTEDTSTPEEIETTLNKIMKICPEAKYQIHGTKQIYAASKEEKEAFKEKLKRQAQQREELGKKDKEEREGTKVREKADQERKAYEEGINKRVSEKEERKAAKRAEREKEKKDETEKFKVKDETEKGTKAIDTEEKKLSKVGKEKKNPFTGFKGLLFDFFSLTGADPKKKQAKKELQDRLRKEWATFRKNEKVLNENKDLITNLGDLLADGKVKPEGISLFNELIARDPGMAKKLDLADDVPSDSKILVSLSKLRKVIKDIDVSAKSEVIEEMIKEFIIGKDKEVSINKVKVDPNINKHQNRYTSIELKDWTSFFKACNLLNLEADDVR